MLEGHPIRRAPDWLKDNNYPLHGRWPPMPSSWACFKSIFCIYTETGNIWTLLLGFALFLFLGILTTLRPNMYFMAPPSGEGGVWDSSALRFLMRHAVEGEMARSAGLKSSRVVSHEGFT